MESAPSTKDIYQSPGLKSLGEIAEITNTNNIGGGSIDDGGGDTIYTS